MHKRSENRPQGRESKVLELKSLRLMKLVGNHPAPLSAGRRQTEAEVMPIEEEEPEAKLRDEKRLTLLE
jgi:hypothetical protein